MTRRPGSSNIRSSRYRTVPTARPKDDFSGDTVTLPVEVRPLYRDDDEPLPCLVVQNSDQVGQRCEIRGDVLRIGRADDAELRIRDHSISRYHAQVYKNAQGRWCIRDLGSTNGTIVNGRRIEDVALKDRDSIQLGKNFVLSFEYHGPMEGQFYEQLYKAATHDPQLGIFTRKYIEERVDTDFKLARRSRDVLSVLVIAIDKYEQLLETRGNTACQRIQLGLSSLFNGRLRGSDLLARFDDERFVMVLRSTTLQGSLILADELCELVNAAPFEARGLQIPITISIGVAAYAEATPFRNTKALLRAGENALERALETGGDQVEPASLDDAKARRRRRRRK